MRFTEYLASGVALFIAYVISLLVYVIISSILRAFGVPVWDITEAMKIIGYIIGGGFLLYVIFDYIYNIIVGEDENI